MLVIEVADMATSREGRNGDHGNARTGPEEINRLNEARIIVTAALVHCDKNRGFGPLFRVALRQCNDVLSEGFEETPFRRSGMALQQPVRLYLGNCGTSPLAQIGHQTNDIP